MSRGVPSRTISRRDFSSSGIASSSFNAACSAARIFEDKYAVVFDQMSGSRFREFGSVSPGKPTMMSVVMLISRLADFIHAMRSNTDHECTGAAWPRDPRGAGLHRQVNVVAQGRDCFDGIDDVLAEIARMRRGEADAADSWDFATAASSSAKVFFLPGSL